MENLFNLFSGGTSLVTIVLIVLSLAFFKKIFGSLSEIFFPILRGIMAIVMPFIFLAGKHSRFILSKLPVVRKKMPALTERISDYLMSKGDNINFDVRKTAEKYWPADEYPELYKKVRPGLKRAFFDDGKLVGDYDLSLLIDNLYSRDLYINAIRSGVDVAIAIAIGFFIVATVIDISSVTVESDQSELRVNNEESGFRKFFEDLDKTPEQVERDALYKEQSRKGDAAFEAKHNDRSKILETWGDYNLVKETSLSEHFDTAKRFAVTIVSALSVLILDIVLFALASIAVFTLAASILIPAIVSKSINDVSKKWRITTKDALTRNRLRRSDVALSREVFRKALNVDTYIEQCRGTDLIKIGTATGTFANRGAIGNPLKNDDFVLDMESLFQHTLVFGGTGEGKTTAVIKPTFKQVVDITNDSGNRFGALCLDAKGVLWRDLKRAADSVGRGGDVILIGADAGMSGIDPLAHLKPADLASACRSVMSSTGESKESSFWSDMAAVLIGHVAALVYAIAHLKKDNEGTITKEYYSLKSIYHLISNDKALTDALGMFIETVPNQKFFSSDFDQLSQLVAALNYLNGSWALMAGPTKTGIVANASKILDPIYSNPNLGDKFSAENSAVERIEKIFDGKLLMLSISSVEHNISAKLLQILIKTAFYRAARIREIKIGSAECQKKPVLVVIDEAQEIVTADSSGLSDGSYWNVARSGGVAGLLGTQTIAALYQAMGRDSTINMVQQFRSKVFLRTEDIETHKYCIELAGQERRALSYKIDTPESLEYIVNTHGYDFADYSRAEEAAESAKNVVDKANVGTIFSILKNSETIKNSGSIDSLFEVDQRFKPGVPLFNQAQNPNEQINYMKDATWRAEDKYREFLSEGNEALPLLSSSDIINAGRFYAYMHVQRAGLPVQDIVEITHDFD